MAKISMKELLEAGVHFGHQTKRWNPKMARFIFGERNGIYILNLEETVKCIEEARDFLEGVIAEGEMVLFVGCKRQAQDSIANEAKRCGMPYVNQRWLGGTLTNFKTIRKSIGRLHQLEKMVEDGTIERIIKKERVMLNKETEKLKKVLGGIVNMEKLPGAVFVVDPKREEITVKEAKKLSIPIVAIVDTNCDPDMITYPLPGNDDAIKAIELLTKKIADSVIEGREKLLKTLEAEPKKPKAAKKAKKSPEEPKKEESDKEKKSDEK